MLSNSSVAATLAITAYGMPFSRHFYLPNIIFPTQASCFRLSRLFLFRLKPNTCLLIMRLRPGLAGVVIKRDFNIWPAFRVEHLRIGLVWTCKLWYHVNHNLRVHVPPA